MDVHISHFHFTLHYILKLENIHKLLI